MKKKSGDELRHEYDFDYTKAVRGKYYRELLEEGSNVVVLDPDIAKAFGDSASVNEALRCPLSFPSFNVDKHNQHMKLFRQ